MVYRVPIDSVLRPEQVVPMLDLADTPGVLSGSWFGGGTLLFRRPLRVATAPDVTGQPGGDGPDGMVGGGWLVCLGFDRATSTAAFYDSVLRWQPDEGWSYEALGLTGREDAYADGLAYWTGLLGREPGADRDIDPELPPLTTSSAAGDTRDRYLAEVEQVIGAIRRGAFYQLNLCIRLHGAAPADPLASYGRMLGRLQPAYGGLVSSHPDRLVLSCSPELFLRVQGRRVISSPIKGTAPRTAGDDEGAERLRASAKDAAENVMIVDLIRNDLSRVCEPGSVAVEELLGLQPHPGVWHLVSTVAGVLRPEVTTTELLAATFPPGSVTGAPKRAALAGIAAAEPEPRGAYTGALGLISPWAGTELNVLIRTLELTGGRAELGVGGGITVDSVPIREWYECLHKAAPIVVSAGSRLAADLLDEPARPGPALSGPGVFESILVVDGSPRRLADHLARLDRSVRELYGAGLPTDLETGVDAAVGRVALRVSARPAASGLVVDVTSRALGPRLTHCTLAYAERPEHSWRHKWGHRSALDAAEAVVGPALPYFRAPDGSISESSRGNLFLLGLDGRWRTPPLDEQLLPGVTRRAILDLDPGLGIDATIERTRPDDVQAAFWTSSLSGAVAVTALDGRPLAEIGALTARITQALGIG